jgi:hypothetical protein
MPFPGVHRLGATRPSFGRVAGAILVPAGNASSKHSHSRAQAPAFGHCGKAATSFTNAHIGISDRRVENNALNEFRQAFRTEKRPDVFRNTGVSVLFVFLFRVLSVDLIEIFRVNPLSIRSAVESPDKVRVCFVFHEFSGKISDRTDGGESEFRHVDSHFPGQRHHREFVFRHSGESWRWQFCDPLAVSSLRWNAKLFSASTYCREFELNTGREKRSTSSLFASRVADFSSGGGSGCPSLSSAITAPGKSAPTSHSNENSLSGLIPAVGRDSRATRRRAPAADLRKREASAAEPRAAS